VIRFLIAVLFSFMLLLQPASARRVALVIANGRYAHVPLLKNPPADGRLIASALKRAGFDSVDVRPDLGKAALEGALRDFGRQAEGADVALIYYAGHGIEAGGENYLIPTDAKLERDRDLDVEATKMETVLRMGDGARMRIVILDACRNNPFLASMQRSVRSRAVGRGLAAIEPEGETLVVYAAKAGATAADGAGTNSPFAEALAGRLIQPGLEIGLLFRSVRDDVLKRTNREQEPFTYGSLSGNAFYFILGSKAAPPQIAAIPKQAPGPAMSDESLFWQGALSANTQAGYRDYLLRYPKGRFAGLARDSILRLKQPVTAPAPASLPSGEGQLGSIIRQSRFDNGIFPNMARAFSANGAPVMPTGDVGALIRRFEFSPDPAVRTQAREKMLANFGKPGSDMRKQFETAIPLANPFLAVGNFVEQYGLSTTNAVDAAFLHFETMRRKSALALPQATSAQINAARRQIAGAMARDPFFQKMGKADLQLASDSMFFQTIIITHNDSAFAKLGSKYVDQLRDSMGNIAEQTFGFPVDKLRLTDQGYVK
jgi:uncharacterized caspase-like protein